MRFWWPGSALVFLFCLSSAAKKGWLPGAAVSPPELDSGILKRKDDRRQSARNGQQGSTAVRECAAVLKRVSFSLPMVLCFWDEWLPKFVAFKRKMEWRGPFGVSLGDPLWDPKTVFPPLKWEKIRLVANFPSILQKGHYDGWVLVGRAVPYDLELFNPFFFWFLEGKLAALRCECFSIAEWSGSLHVVLYKLRRSI